MDLIDVLDCSIIDLNPFDNTSIVPNHLVESILLDIPPEYHRQLMQVSSPVKEYFDNKTFFDTYLNKYTKTNRIHEGFRGHTKISYFGTIKHGLEKTYYYPTQERVDKGLMGSPECIIPYLYGLRDGTVIKYYSSSVTRQIYGLPGPIKSTTQYVNGHKHGKTKKYYYPSLEERSNNGLPGLLKSIISYTDGQRDGTVIEYCFPSWGIEFYGFRHHIKSMTKYINGQKVATKRYTEEFTTT